MVESVESKIQERLAGLFDDYCLNGLQKVAAMKFIKDTVANPEEEKAARVRSWMMHKMNNKVVSPPHPRQRGSPDIIPNLTASPWWDTSQFPWVREIEERFPEIRAELLTLYRRGGFQPYRGPTWASKILAPDFGSQSHDSGDWNVFYLYLHGVSFDENLEKCPITNSIIRSLVPRHYDHAFFSAVNPNTHIVEHHGPTNKKLRLHLPIIGTGGSRLRACDETKSFNEGVAFIFDDSFDHEAWHDGDTTRVNLIIDFWHPDLSNEEVKFLKMLQNAKMRIEKQLTNDEEDTFYNVIEKAKDLRPDDNSWWTLSEEDTAQLSGLVDENNE